VVLRENAKANGAGSKTSYRSFAKLKNKFLKLHFRMTEVVWWWVKKRGKN
jgi:hypothetical protein